MNLAEACGRLERFERLERLELILATWFKAFK